MIFQRVLNVKVLYICLVGLLCICTIVLYTVYVLLMYVGDSTYRVTEQTKTYCTLFDCLCNCYIDPVQRTKMKD